MGGILVIVCENGAYREATMEELSSWTQAAQEQQEQPPTVEDRVQILEEALELLLSGVTE